MLALFSRFCSSLFEAFCFFCIFSSWCVQSGSFQGELLLNRTTGGQYDSLGLVIFARNSIEVGLLNTEETQVHRTLSETLKDLDSMTYFLYFRDVGSICNLGSTSFQRALFIVTVIDAKLPIEGSCSVN